MSHEFVAKRGLISRGDVQVTGSLTATGVIFGHHTGSTFGTASWATNSLTTSYADSLTVNNDLTVGGILRAGQISSSFIYITSSYIVVTDNILTLNAQTPHVRYAGIEVWDSGSTDQMASVLWDGENNYFFISSSDAGYSKKIILGPSGEVDLTVGKIPVVTTGDSIGDSIIQQIGSEINITGNLVATSVTASLMGTASNAISASYVPNLYPQIIQTTVDSASWVSASVFITTAQTASYITSSNIFGKVTAFSSSWASASVSASYVPNLYPQTYQESGSWASSSISASYLFGPHTGSTFGTASWALSSSTAISASYSPVEPDYSSSVSLQIDTKQNNIVTGSTLPITASWANYISSSNIIGNVTAFSASWASASISASYVPNLYPQTYQESGSWASASLSASYSPVQPSYSASISDQFATKQDTLVIGNTYSITSSWANDAITASYISSSNIFGSITALSSSWASASISSSYVPNLYPQVIQTTVDSASWVSASVFITTAQTASYVSSSNVIGIITAFSSSWASASISASYVPNLYPQTYQESGSWASSSISSSYATSASYVPNLYPQVTQTTVDSASWVSASVFITTAQTASYITASNIFGTVTSSSYALSASWSPQPAIPTSVPSSSWASSSISASYALTASFALNASALTSASWASSSLSASYLNAGANIYLSQSYIFANTNSIAPSFKSGQLWYDSLTHTYTIDTDKTNVRLQIGQENYVRIVAGELIADGNAVYISGSNINKLPIAYLAIADGTGLKNLVVGLSTQPLTIGEEGFATTVGVVNNINTSTLIDGDVLYLSDVTSGSFTNIIPLFPAEKVIVGTVLYSGISGKILVDLSQHNPREDFSIGVIDIPTLSNIGSTIYIGASKVNFCINLSGKGIIRSFTVPSASFTITTAFLDVQYILANYNNGNPIYQIATNMSTVDNIQTVQVATFTLGSGGNFSYVDWDSSGLLLSNKLERRIIDIYGAQRASGLEIGTSGSHITITSGTGYLGVKQLTFTSSSTANTNQFALVAHSASIWSGSFINGYVTTHYDDGINLRTLGSGKYVVNYVYRGIGSLNRSQVLLSPQYVNYGDAVKAIMPIPPAELSNISIFCGRIITQEGDGASLVESAFTTILSVAGITDHNLLNDIQGGTPGQYYHLSSASYAQMINGTASYAYTASYVSSSNIFGNITAFSASWASASISASYVPNLYPQTFQASGSWASSSLSASWAQSASIASTASYVSSSNIFGNVTAFSASWASASISSSYTLKSYWNDITKEPSGFPNRTDSTLTYESSSAKLMISGSNWKVYCNGNEFIKNNESIVISTPTKGQLYYIYYDTNGVLQQAVSEWSFVSGIASVCTVYIEAGAGNGFVSDERHGIIMDGMTHEYLHETIGPRYASGFAWTTTTASLGKYAISAGEWYDDDLEFKTTTILSSSLMAYYSGAMVVSTTETSSMYGGGTEKYNNTTLGTLVNITGGNAGCFFIYAINGISNNLVSIYGQRIDTSVANARTNNTPNTLIFGNFPFREAKLLYRVIVTTAGISETTDYRTAQYAGSTFTPTSHGSLTGLSNDDHPQYLLLAGRDGQAAATFTGSIVGSSSYATSASYVPNLYPQTYQVSGSWASSSLSASYVSSSNIFGNVTAFSASWASSSISASYAPVQPSYSSSVSVQFGTKQDTLVTGNTYFITSSWSISSSYAPNLYPQTYQISGSWASSSISSSYSTTAGTANAISFVPLTATSASWVSASVFITTAQTASYVSSSNITGNITAFSASWASSSLSSSYPWFTTGSNIAYVGGNVGIGIATPNEGLEVYAKNIYLNGAGTTAGGLLFTRGAAKTLTSTQAGIWFEWNGGLAGNNESMIFNVGYSEYDYRFKIAGADKLVISKIGNVGIGTTVFNGTAAERLLVSGSTYNVISGVGNLNSYLQLNIKNSSAGNAASSDIVATNDTGNETGNFVDLGINSSGYTSNIVGLQNDGYLYNTGSNFYIGNISPGKNLYLFAGSTSNTASMMISASGNVGIGTTTPGALLHVQGLISGSSVSVTGNITTNTLTVTGLLTATQISGSQVYITSSQLTVTDNILTLNANSPHLRYAGIEMYDSGSTSNLASFLWDGTNNYFFLSSSDAGYSRKIVTGPDSEGNLTANYIPLAIANNGLNNSVMFQSSSNIGIGTTGPGAKLDVTGAENTVIAQITAPFTTPGTERYSSLKFNNSIGAWGVSEIRNNNNGALTLGSELSFLTSNPSTGVVAERMRITNVGNVGIGTTSPSYKLDLVGPFISADNKTAVTGKSATFLAHQYDSAVETEGFVMMNTYADATMNRIDIGGGHSSYNAATAITFNTAANTTTRTGTERMVITSAGNVGIGTTAPGNMFQVGGTANAARYFEVSNGGQPNIRYDDNSALHGLTLTNRGITGAGNGSYILFSNAAGAAAAESAASIAGISENATHTGATADGALTFNTALNGGLNEAMRIISTGNVGIGTTGPNNLLTVGSSASPAWNSAYKVIDNSGFGFLYGSANGTGWTGTGYGQTGWGNNQYYAGGVSSAVGTGASSFILQGAGQIAFYTAPSVTAGSALTYTEAMRVINGNVGIGTTAPGSKLHIADTVADQTATDLLTLSSLDGGGGVGVFTSDSIAFRDANQLVKSRITFFHNAYHSAGTEIGFSTQKETSQGGTGTVDERMRITSAGNVGIGTTTPRKFLEVNGAAIVGGSANNLYLSGDAINADYDVNANSELALNYQGYLGGVTQFRDVGIYNGKVGRIAFFQGSTGNVGIGTTAPTTRLHLVAPSSSANAMSIDNTAGTGRALQITNTTNTTQYALGIDTQTYGIYLTNADTSSNKTSLDIITGGVGRFSVMNNGNVGIGTTSPGAMLHINGSVINGNTCTATGAYSHAEGEWTYAGGDFSHAEGLMTTATGAYSHAEGISTYATGNFSHAEGGATNATGDYSHAEGGATNADGLYSHAEGGGTRTIGLYSHAEGSSTTATGDWSHAEGDSTAANGGNSHAEGGSTTSNGNFSHAEGRTTTSNGDFSHAEGYNTTATGLYSHAEGNSTIAYASYQTVVGQFNIANNSTDLFVVGGGSSDGARKDILKVSTTGLVISGSVGVTGVVTCLSLTETSTLAMKEDIEPLTDQLMNILKLNPVSFTYKNTQEASIGLIAEEVAEIYPEFTSKNHDAISYGKIVSVLIKGIKELKEIVDNQQKQINRLLG